MKNMVKYASSLALILCMSFTLFLAHAAQADQSSGTAASSAAPAAKVPSTSRVKAIWDYKDQLGLSSTQIETIQNALKSFQEQLIKMRANLQVSELKVQDLLQKKAEMTNVKAQVEKSAGIQVQMRMADIETARKIEDTLTPTQLSKWRAIQLEARKKTENRSKS